jgi:mannose-6-phosphate isomerase-like protein (cupin superfamily)
MNAINLKNKFEKFKDHWNPRIVGELNGQYVKVAKLKGEFVMHKHDKEDELFLVWNGQLKIALEDKTVTLNPGEFFIVPKGVLHKPIAEEEVEVVLFEPKGVLNTGNVSEERTRRELEWI